MKNIWLWRHGQTDYNVNQRVQGQVDIPLNTVGTQQAQAAAAMLRQRLGGASPVIVSSDLQRAAATAAELARLTGVEIGFDPRLRERSFGPWEGHTRQEMEVQWPREYAVWRAGGEPEGIGVETKAAVGQRVLSAVEQHTAQLEPGQVLVVVSHGSAITQGLVRMLGLDHEGRSPIRGLDNCHWSEVGLRSAPANWVLLAHNLGANTTRLHRA